MMTPPSMRAPVRLSNFTSFSHWLDSKKPWVQNLIVGVMLLALPLLGAGVWNFCGAVYQNGRNNRAMIERVSDFIDEATKMKARYRVTSPNDYDAADPQPAVQWESSVCDYLTRARDRSYCIRFNSRLPNLDDPTNQRRDVLVERIDARIERLELLLMDLAKPAP